jgi:hypothetical protein
MHYAILRPMLDSSERVHQCQPCCLGLWSLAFTLLPCASVSQVDFQDPVDGSLRLVLQSSTWQYRSADLSRTHDPDFGCHRALPFCVGENVEMPGYTTFLLDFVTSLD